MGNDNKRLSVGGGEKARKEKKKERPCGSTSAVTACTLQLVPWKACPPPWKKSKEGCISQRVNKTSQDHPKNSMPRHRGSAAVTGVDAGKNSDGPNVRRKDTWMPRHLKWRVFAACAGLVINTECIIGTEDTWHSTACPHSLQTHIVNQRKVRCSYYEWGWHTSAQWSFSIVDEPQ